jgi:hypothetical protein
MDSVAGAEPRSPGASQAAGPLPGKPAPQPTHARVAELADAHG